MRSTIKEKNNPAKVTLLDSTSFPPPRGGGDGVSPPSPSLITQFPSIFQILIYLFGFKSPSLGTLQNTLHAYSGDKRNPKVTFFLPPTPQKKILTRKEEVQAKKSRFTPFQFPLPILVCPLLVLSRQQSLVYTFNPLGAHLQKSTSSCQIGPFQTDCQQSFEPFKWYFKY